MVSDIDQPQTTHTPLEEKRKKVEERKIESEKAKKKAYLKIKEFGKFFVDENGIHMDGGYYKDGTEKPTVDICSIPCSIEAMGKNIDDENTIAYKIEFSDNNDDEKSVWKTEDSLLDNKHVESLRTEGLGFTSRNASNMNEFFDNYIKCIKNYLPREIIANRSGWKKNNTLFVYGRYGFTKNGIESVHLMDNSSAKNYHTEGSEEAWIEGLKDTLGYDVVRMKGYMFFYPIIGQLIYTEPCVVENNCKSDSSVFKSDSSNVCLSFFGNPIKLQISATSTEKSIPKHAEENNCLPISIDELTVNKNKAFEDLIYTIVNGQPRKTLSRDSKIIESNEFYVLLMVTGEVHILHDKSYEGQKVRLVPLPWGIEKILSIEEIDKIKETYTNNYGWVGKRFVQKVFKYKDNLREIFIKNLKEFPESDNTKIRRINKTYAGIATAGMLLEEVFKDMGIPTIDPLELTKKLYKENVEDTGIFEEPRYVKALKSVYSWYSSEYTFFRGSDYEISKNELGMNTEFKPSKNCGWLLYDKKEDYEYVGFVPKILKDKLKEEGFQDPDQIIDDWAENGIIVSSKEDYKDKKSGKQKTRIRYDLSSYVSKDIKPKLIRVPTENFFKYTSNKYLDEGIAEEDESEEEKNDFDAPEPNLNERHQNLIETAEGIALAEREEADERAKYKVELREDGMGHVRISSNQQSD